MYFLGGFQRVYLQVMSWPFIWPTKGIRRIPAMQTLSIVKLWVRVCILNMKRDLIKREKEEKNGRLQAANDKGRN